MWLWCVGAHTYGAYCIQKLNRSLWYICVLPCTTLVKWIASKCLGLLWTKKNWQKLSGKVENTKNGIYMVLTGSKSFSLSHSFSVSHFPAIVWSICRMWRLWKSRKSCVYALQHAKLSFFAQIVLTHSKRQIQSFKIVASSINTPFSE